MQLQELQELQELPKHQKQQHVPEELMDNHQRLQLLELQKLLHLKQRHVPEEMMAKSASVMEFVKNCCCFCAHVRIHG
jgi:hypothetical protein